MEVTVKAEGLYLVNYLPVTLMRERNSTLFDRSDEAKEIDANLRNQAAHKPEHLRELSRRYKEAAAEFDEDNGMQILISQVDPDTTETVLRDVLKKLINSESLTWKTVLLFFYFAYKLCIKSLASIKSILTLFGEFLTTFIVPWVVKMGGWASLIGRNNWRRLSKKKKPIFFGSIFIVGAACIGYVVYRRYA
ncbi:hypothetical protein Btru_074820 [Bulinus truncatus]|nr:hypothetical protein Btru_074820 [Bulinus truncatus]